MKILAIDDEKLALEALVSAIRQSCPEAEIRSFRKSDELIRYAEKHHCDIAFLDIKMNGITGVEIAEQLKKHNPHLNIIFVTGYDDYTGNAMELHASGYIMKPVTAEKVAQELNDLRYPVNDSNHVTLSIKCFGNFEAYLPDGDILRFERAKAKEVFAYLVYRQGASSTIKEIAARIFENEEYDLRHQMYLQKIISSMMKTLKQINAEHIITKAYNSISVNTEFIDCDYYRAVNQEPHALSTYTGEFMAQYSWAEYMNGYLYRLANGKK